MTNLIGKPGYSTTGTGSLAFPVAAGASYVVTVHEVATGGGCASYTIRVTTRTSCDQPGYDSDADGEADFAWFTPGTGQWWVGNLPSGAGSAFTFGQSGDIVTPGDYTGDGRTDLSVYRPSNNTWYYATNQVTPATNIATVPWGSPGDVPVQADYDRDGKTDIAVWRPSDGRWYILRSTNITLSVFNWGAPTDTPITGDYDGDLIADISVVRNEASVKRWFVLLSNYGNSFVLGCPTDFPICGSGTVFGAPTDRPVSGDFDGDFKTDVAVWRPSNGTWYYYRSSSATAANSAGANFSQGQFGQNGDIPQPADYDGDNKFDLAVMRPGVAWWVLYSSNGSVVSVNTVDPTIQPATSPYRISNP
jgi:hypothetical protein